MADVSIGIATANLATPTTAHMTVGTSSPGSAGVEVRITGTLARGALLGALQAILNELENPSALGNINGTLVMFAQPSN